MKWNHEKSIVLSKISVIVFFVIYLVVLVFCWNMNGQSSRLSAWLGVGLTETYITFLRLVVYICAVPLGLILFILYRLIQAIGKEEIFTAENIRRLRQISWLCMLVGLICTGAAVYEIFFIIIAACAVFMGILLRVIKNVFERAQEIKEENDYTI